MKDSLKGEIAVITGGNGGIGKGIVKKFAEEGATIALLGTNAQKGAQAIEEIRQKIPEAQLVFYTADLSSKLETETALEQVLKEFGRIDILVNNAGVTADQLLMKMTEEQWDKVIDVNLKSCYNTCHMVIRSMIKARKGVIINMSSVVGLIGNPGQTSYAAAKAGIIGFSKSLAKEVANRKILVNCIAPGFIKTQMTEALTEAQIEKILPTIPMGRMGEVEDIANMAWFLASPLARYITGQVFTVDGGMVM